eukprot:581270-Pyramimonas_sp.AAC.1
MRLKILPQRIAFHQAAVEATGTSFYIPSDLWDSNRAIVGFVPQSLEQVWPVAASSGAFVVGGARVLRESGMYASWVRTLEGSILEHHGQVCE